MVTKEQIDRINRLAKKAKAQGLNDDEKEEQQELRSLYLASIRENVISQLSQIRFKEQEEPEEIMEEMDVVLVENGEEEKQ